MPLWREPNETTRWLNSTARRGTPSTRSSSGWEGTGAPKTTTGRSREDTSAGEHQSRRTKGTTPTARRRTRATGATTGSSDGQDSLATQRAPRRLPALLSESGAAGDGSEILLECKILYIVWGTRPSPRTILFSKLPVANKGQTCTSPRTSQDRQTEGPTV